MRRIILAGIGALLIPLAGCAGANTTTTGARPRPTYSSIFSTVSPSPSRTPSPAATTARPPATTQAPPPPTTAPALPADQVFQGYGDKVIKLSLDSEHVHIAAITHRGSSNFTVESLDESGNMVDLVVNEIGNYSGVRPLDFRETPVALKVGADGSWKITVQVVQKAPLWTGNSSGKGAAVLRVDPGALDGLTTVTITHSGTSNFAVWAYGTNSDLLVNEIGRYSGETLIPAGTVVLDIEADGAWTIRKS